MVGKWLWGGDKGATDGRLLGGPVAPSMVTMATGSMTSCGGLTLSLLEPPRGSAEQQVEI